VYRNCPIVGKIYRNLRKTLNRSRARSKLCPQWGIAVMHRWQPAMRHDGMPGLRTSVESRCGAVV
jgi:hypothetical protein